MKWSQIFILTTRNGIYSHIAFYKAKNGKKLQFMVMNLMKMVQNTQNHQILLLLKWWSISVWVAHLLFNKQTVQLEYHLYIIFWHICITCAGCPAKFTNLLLIPFLSFFSLKGAMWLIDARTNGWVLVFILTCQH